MKNKKTKKIKEIDYLGLTKTIEFYVDIKKAITKYFDLEILSLGRSKTKQVTDCILKFMELMEGIINEK